MGQLDAFGQASGAAGVEQEGGVVVSDRGAGVLHGGEAAVALVLRELPDLVQHLHRGQRPGQRLLVEHDDPFQRGAARQLVLLHGRPAERDPGPTVARAMREQLGRVVGVDGGAHCAQGEQGQLGDQEGDAVGGADEHRVAAPHAQLG